MTCCPRVNSLAGATRRFAQGLKVEDVGEAGQPDVDLSALLESECSAFEEIGCNVAFCGAYGVRCATIRLRAAIEYRS
jgi:hypothetical protein